MDSGGFTDYFCKREGDGRCVWFGYTNERGPLLSNTLLRLLTSCAGAFPRNTGTASPTDAMPTMPAGRILEGSDTHLPSSVHLHPPLLVIVRSHCSLVVNDSQITAPAGCSMATTRSRPQASASALLIFFVIWKVKK